MGVFLKIQDAPQMHTCNIRFFSVFSILFNASTILLFAVSLLSFLYDKDPHHSFLKIESLQPVTTEYRERHIILNPNTNLTDVFHLNVKQVFLYVKMINGDKKEMIWSKIIKKHDKKQILDPVANNYRFFEIEKGTNLKFELRGCIFPHVGLTKDKIFSEATFHVTDQ